MHITIHISEAAARALHRQTPAMDASDEIVRTAQELGVALEAMHPDRELFLPVSVRQHAEPVVLRVKIRRRTL